MAITCNDIIVLAAQHMQDAGYSTNTQNEYIAMANKAQNRIAEIERKNVTSNATTDSVSGTQAYALPSDFMKLYEADQAITYTDANGKKHWPNPTDYAEVRGYDDLNTLTGTPSCYWLDARNRLWFYPTPDFNGTDNIKIEYLMYPTTLALTTDPCDFPDKYLFAVAFYTAAFMAMKNELTADAKKFETAGQLELNIIDNSSPLMANRFEKVGYTNG